MEVRCLAELCSLQARGRTSCKDPSVTLVAVVALALPLAALASSASRSAGAQNDGLRLAPGAPLVLEGDEAWRGAGDAMLLSGVFGATAGNSSRSVYVIDGSDAWHRFSHNMHRSHLAEVKELMVATGSEDPGDDAPGAYNSYNIAVKQPHVYLHRFASDVAVQDALSRVFGVSALGCFFGREKGVEVLLLLQNVSMAPDSFHKDICDDDWPGYKEITVLTYPHDSWDPAWRGHFELGNEERGAVAALAPLGNRSIIFDGCIQHRATNPSADSAPVRHPVIVSHYFRRVLRLGARLRWWHLSPRFGFRGWRFSVAMQLRCPVLPGSKREPSRARGPAAEEL